MPVPVVFSVELVLEMGGDLLGGVHLVQGVFGDTQYFCLQLGRYVLALDHRLVLTHLSHAVSKNYLIQTI